MKNDRVIHISTGASRKSVSWQQVETTWSDFCERLRTPQRGRETIAEYLAMPKSRQDELKDVGGYVGGTLSGERRKAANVTGRDLVTLDLDSIPANETEAILDKVDRLGCAAVVYSTRKHTKAKPRLRVVLPLDRTVTPDEYEPIARKLGQVISLSCCDPTTFEAVRLMYWASCSRDSDYVYRTYDKPFVSASGILAMYGDWRDVSQWPSPDGDVTVRRKIARQENPLDKQGIVGAFCRVYTVPAAMEKFLPGVYEPTTSPDRYTYMGGSTVGGLVLYDGDLFAYSHHATDPCSGQLVNAWDMVRLHKFGNKDDEVKEGTPAAKMPSFDEMRRLALSDSAVVHLLNKERVEAARDAFGDPEKPPDAPAPAEDDLDWMSQLDVDNNGNPRKTINNFVLVLRHDPLLRDRIVTDEFAGCGRAIGALPWNTSSDEWRRWSDADDAGALWYMETTYGMDHKEKLAAALAIVGGQKTVNEVREYLMALNWDEVPRLDTLLIDYLGADDTDYTRAVMRKSMCAAVARAVVGGIKYDYMPILAGPQGIGKSTFLATLGKKWFSDSLTTFEGRDAAEMLQGTWINEIGELTAMTRYEASAVKQFLSKRNDIYRAPYGRRTEEHPRRCVFFGTTNDAEFLKDSTGNRRFWPVDVGLHEATKSVWDDLPGEVDQIWAEAVVWWRLGERLYMDGQLAKAAEAAQQGHKEVTGKEGLVEEYLSRMVPENWNQMDVGARKMFLAGNAVTAGKLVPMDRVCAAQVWVEVFGGDIRFMKRADALELNHILEQMPGWERVRNVFRMGPYGTQKGFKRSDN